MAEHGPRDRRPIALGLERELGGAGAGHGLHEIEFDPDELGRAALGQRHAPFADLPVAGPGEDRALAGRRALEGGLRVGVEFRPGRPRVPFMEVVHLREDVGRGAVIVADRAIRYSEGCSATNAANAATAATTAIKIFRTIETPLCNAIDARRPRAAPLKPPR